MKRELIKRGVIRRVIIKRDVKRGVIKRGVIKRDVKKRVVIKRGVIKRDVIMRSKSTVTYSPLGELPHQVSLLLYLFGPYLYRFLYTHSSLSIVVVHWES